MENNHGERSHSELGGSSANRWANCIGSVFLARDLPTPETSEAATEGTRAHEIAEELLRGFLEYKINGADYPNDYDSRKFTGEMYVAGKEYVNTIWLALEESITGKGHEIEAKVTIDENLQMFGFIDFYAVYRDEKAKRVGYIADFKYGYHVVNIEKNYQLAYYAVALRTEMRKKGKDLDYVRAAIFQPRAQGEAYKETTFTAKELDTYEKKFRTAAHDIYVKKKPKFKTGEWCRFCNAQAVCKKYSDEIREHLSLQVIDTEEVVLPVPEQLNEESIVKIVLNEDAILSFLKACKTHVMNKCTAGAGVKGLKVVEGPKRRKWLEDEEHVATKLVELGVAEPYEKSLKNLGVVEKLLSLEMTKEKAKEAVSSLCTYTTPSLSIVPESDKRPAVQNARALLSQVDT